MFLKCIESMTAHQDVSYQPHTGHAQRHDIFISLSFVLLCFLFVFPVFHLGLPVFSSVSPFYPMVRFCFLVPLVFYLVGQLVLCLAFCVATFWFFALLGFLVLGYFQLFLNKARFQFLILPASRVFLR